jgi:competence protein ComEA
MQISEFSKQKIKSFFSFLNSQFAIRKPQLFKYLSLGQQKVLFFLAIFILAALYFRFYYHPLPFRSEEIVREFVVEVSGEVPNPGIYFFQNPPTLKEAIKKAGGLKENALLETNLSPEVLETGTLITILKESNIKVKWGRMQANKLLVFSIPLDINRVSIEDLCLIPGIGESLAREIVAYRERRRGFRSVEELINVKGIREKKYKFFNTFFITRP